MIGIWDQYQLKLNRTKSDPLFTALYCSPLPQPASTVQHFTSTPVNIRVCECECICVYRWVLTPLLISKEHCTKHSGSRFLSYPYPALTAAFTGRPPVMLISWVTWYQVKIKLVCCPIKCSLQPVCTQPKITVTLLYKSEWSVFPSSHSSNRVTGLLSRWSRHVSFRSPIFPIKLSFYHISNLSLWTKLHC